MGNKITPDVFQQIMSKLTKNLEYVKAYLDELLLLCNIDFKDHLIKLEMVLARLSVAGMRIKDLLLGAVIMQNNKLLSFYSLKLNPA